MNFNSLILTRPISFFPWPISSLGPGPFSLSYSSHPSQPFRPVFARRPTSSILSRRQVGPTCQRRPIHFLPLAKLPWLCRWARKFLPNFVHNRFPWPPSSTPLLTLPLKSHHRCLHKSCVPSTLPPRTYKRDPRYRLSTLVLSPQAQLPFPALFSSERDRTAVVFPESSHRVQSSFRRPRWVSAKTELVISCSRAHWSFPLSQFSVSRSHT